MNKTKIMASIISANVVMYLCIYDTMKCTLKFYEQTVSLTKNIYN